MADLPSTPEPAAAAPQTALEAARQLDGLGRVLDERRRTSLRMRAARDAAETLYRKEQAKARLVAEGSNDGDRQAWVATRRLDAAQVQASHEIGRQLFGEGSDWKAETVGDLRWLRDRAEGMAEATSAAAYDSRERIRGWVMVAAWAKAERDDVMSGPHDTP